MHTAALATAVLWARLSALRLARLGAMSDAVSVPKMELLGRLSVAVLEKRLQRLCTVQLSRWGSHQHSTVRRILGHPHPVRCQCTRPVVQSICAIIKANHH